MIKIKMNKLLSKPLIVAGVFLLISNSAFAQGLLAADPAANGLNPERLAKIDKIINAEISTGLIPGAVAVVARNGKIVYQKSFGFADIESKTPMHNNNIFRIASMSKAVTTVAAMMLYERGLFKLGDPISKFLPAFSTMQVITEVGEDGSLSTTAATRPIRVIDLMTHSSGISYPFNPGKLQETYIKAGLIDGLTEKDLKLSSQMDILAQQPLLFEPGSDVAYGLSTDLLGYLVEVVSGKTLEQFFVEEIFTPLGMHDSHFYLPKDKADRLVTLYAYIPKKGLVVSKGQESSIKLDNPRYPVEGAHSYFSGGAGLSSTAIDYARLCQMLLNNGELNGKHLLSRKSVELIRTARMALEKGGALNFGLGFYINDLAISTEIGSTGSYSWGGAFNTSFWIDPQENLVGVIMGQARPNRSDINARFKIMVYQTLE
jgi:CubicO group peptidase (beta-lactamase class C family)